MFVAHEGQHPKHIFTFQVCRSLYGKEDRRYLGINVVIPVRLTNVFLLKRIGSQGGKQTVGIGSGITEVCPDDAVAQLECTEEQVGGETQAEQCLLVFGV